jgi:hypothetical protein
MELRTQLISMTDADRVQLLVTFWPGILAMTFFYMTLTAIRDFRDNSARVVVVLSVGRYAARPFRHFAGDSRNSIRTLVAYHIFLTAGMLVVSGPDKGNASHASCTCATPSVTCQA